ncbi:MAG TPA: vitamin B12 dependent methionine synthase [Clostridiales bacterium]|nr:vitamin B12 dependent methionine synthase [Clostridiales bacterium]
MKHTVLDNISFKVDLDRLFRRIHLDPQSEDAALVRNMAAKAEEIGRPKAMYKLSAIDSKQQDHVIVDGVRLSSRVMKVNFENINRVIPYAATCGRELYDWAQGIEDMLEQYWASIIMEQALEEAIKHLNMHLEERFKLGKVKSMNPGSLEDWPISQQKELFSILGNVREAIGLELTDSFLMIPIKSVSGILFQTESDFESCQLCPRENCPNRRAEYNPDLYKEFYKA